MIDNLKLLYTGNAVKIKEKSYFSAKNYIEPFIEKINSYTDKIVYTVKDSEIISITNGTQNLVFNKVLIMGIFSSQYNIVINNETFNRVIVMNYSLDCKKPYCKFYTGVIDSNYNFYAFGLNCISIQEIEEDSALDYSYIQNVINNGLNDNCEIMLDQLSKTFIKVDNIKKYLGSWIDFTITNDYVTSAGKVKLSTTIPIEVYKSLVKNAESDYYITSEEVSILQILKSFINQITNDNKDIINRYEKTQLVNKLLEL